MSGTSGANWCPACGKKNALQTYNDYKPHDFVHGECLFCGFEYWTEESFMTLEEVNSLRKDNNLKPLKKLAAIDDEYKYLKERSKNAKV